MKKEVKEENKRKERKERVKIPYLLPKPHEC